jgi:peptide/nickel transport system substrate-binding protein
MLKNPLNNKKYHRILCGLVLLPVILSACQPKASQSPTLVSSPTVGVIPTFVLPTVTPAQPTAAPEKKLTVCLAQEPASLYPYASPTQSVWSILEAIYDGPIDQVKFTPTPVILQKLPSLADGDASIQPVAVVEGDPVLTPSDEVKTLTKGLTVYPSGCTAQACAVTWDGTTELKMDRLTAKYTLKDGITWSDGTPLTAEDSVYSFQLASDPATPVNRYVVDRTSTYTAVDAKTVEWTGIPGYLDALYQQNYFLPLPKHTWQDIKPADLLTSPVSTEKPLGWGAYVVSEWVKGDHITLKKNPKYFRASEGLPKIETLVYKFPGTQADNNLAALEKGDCDIVDPSAGLESMIEQVLDAQKAGKIKAQVGQGPEWEQIVFNIVPASYADGNYPATGDRPDYFGDVRTRKAFAYCFDRDKAVNKQLLQQSVIPDGFLPPDHPLQASDLTHYAYDVDAGSKLLEEVGWKDDDSNPATPRIAYGVPGVQDGTKLSVNYLVTNAYLRQEIVKVLVDSAAACGIQVNTKTLAPEELYKAAPDGELFGRKFDLAQIAWQAGQRLPCDMFTTSQIPTIANQWMGINLGGYSNPAFDTQCLQARSSSTDASATQTASASVQKQFSDDLPAIPLYFHLKIAATRPDLCGLSMDVSSRSALYGIESYDLGQSCPK